MENFAIQSLVKWLIIKLIPRFIRAFHAHAGLQSYIFFAENQIFSADFRSLRGRGWFGGGHTAARQRVSARSASGGAEGRKVQRLSAQQKARTDATKHPDGRRRAPGRTPQSTRTERDSGGIRPDSGGRIVPGLPVRDGRCAAADGCRGAAATPPRAPRAAPRPPGRPQSGPRNTPDRGSCGRYSRSSPPGRDALR